MEHLPESLAYDVEKFEILKERIRELDHHVAEVNPTKIVFYQKHKAGFAKLLRGHFRGLEGRDNYSSYAFYYILAGGTIGPENPIRHEDFPEEYSIEKFIGRMELEYA